MPGMRRREFVSLFGGAAAVWPIAARAQQSVVPVVGLITGFSADAAARYVAAFRKGLNQTGHVEGQDVTVEYHWLEGHYDRLPALMADLVHRQVAVSPRRPAPSARSLPKLQQRPSRSSSVSPQTRSRLVLSPTSPGPVATRLASIFSTRNWRPSGCDSCTTWCQRPFVLPCSSIRPISRLPRARSATSQKPRTQWDCKSR